MCAAYLPPTNILPIYNTEEYSVANTNLTLSDADLRYLKLTGGVLSGLCTFGSGLSSTGAISITNTTQSTSSITGALKVSGGVGIAKDVRCAGSLHFSGAGSTIQMTGTSSIIQLSGNSSYISLLNTNASTSSITGAFRCSGGAYFGNDSFFNKQITTTCRGASTTQGNLFLKSFYSPYSCEIFCLNAGLNSALITPEISGFDYLVSRTSADELTNKTISESTAKLSTLKVGSAGQTAKVIQWGKEPVPSISIDPDGGEYTLTINISGWDDPPANIQITLITPDSPAGWNNVILSLQNKNIGRTKFNVYLVNRSTSAVSCDAEQVFVMWFAVGE